MRLPRTESRPDWLILRDTILVSIATSPGAFMATAAQIESRPPQFWRRELQVLDLGRGATREPDPRHRRGQASGRGG